MALIMAFAAISTVGSSFSMRLRAATRRLAMKYHYLHSRFTNRMIRVRVCMGVCVCVCVCVWVGVSVCVCAGGQV